MENLLNVKGKKRSIINIINNFTDMQMVYVCLLMYFLLAASQFFLTYCTKAISVYPDELIYMEFARRIAQQDTLLIQNISFPFQNFLYSVIIAPCFFIGDSRCQFTMISLVNSFLVTSSIIPSFFLAKKILKDNVDVMVILIFCFMLPDWNLSILAVSENLFYPLASWTLLEVYNFFEEENKQKKLFYCVICAVLFFACYFTKMISLYFIFAFCAVLFIEWIFSIRSNHLFNIKCLAIVCCIFLLLNIIIFRILFPINGGYGGAVESSIESLMCFDGLLFLGYALICNIASVLLSMLFFPVIIPIISIKSYDNAIRKFLLFTCMALFIAIMALTVMVSLQEDFGDGNIRSHMRYLAILIVPFMICFISRQIKMNIKRKIILCVILLLFIGILYFCIKIPIKNTSMDSVSLALFHDFVINWDITLFDKYLLPEVKLMIFKCGIILIVFLINCIFIMYKGKRRIGVLFCCSILAMINLGNDYCSLKWFKKDAIVPKALIDEAVELNNKLNQLDGNILYIYNGNICKRVYETYVSKMSYLTWSESMLTESENKFECLDLTKEHPMSSFNNIEYMDLNNVNYVITNSPDLIQTASYRLINYSDNKEHFFYLFENIDDSNIMFENRNIFPKNIGEEVVTDSSKTVFYTNHRLNDDGNYVSFNSGGALIYGPGCKISKGKYIISIEYDYSGELEGDIASCEISLNSLGLIAGQKALVSHQMEITFDEIDVLEDCPITEIRVFPYDSDIEIKRIKITKIQ